MAVGAGLQSTVAIINLCCFYLIGVPIGALLGYVAHLQVKVKISLKLKILIDFPIALKSYVVRTLQKSTRTLSLKNRITFGGSDMHLFAFSKSLPQCNLAYVGEIRFYLAYII